MGEGNAARDIALRTLPVLTGTHVHVCRSLSTFAAFAAFAAVSLAVPQRGAEAQRRPGVPMGFYTTTGLLTLDIEAGSVTSTTELTESPRFAVSALITGPVVKQAKRAWIYRARGTALSLGNGDRCSGARWRNRLCDPTLFLTRSFMGSERGQAVGITTLGAGPRWVRKT